MLSLNQQLVESFPPLKGGRSEETRLDFYSSLSPKLVANFQTILKYYSSLERHRLPKEVIKKLPGHG